ncbi:MAG: ribosome-associated translation inhibitor RaiA [Desulfovibrionaceae bacterium]|nr:ribosome-associated translation inhibitor RaiA [Desulfovibrionaceae bacterium]
MNIHVTFKQLDSSEQLKGYAVKRLEKLSKFISDDENAEIFVTLSVDKFRHKADVNIRGKHLHVSAVEQSDDMYASIDMVLDKLEAQVKKHHDKMKDKYRSVRNTRMVRLDVLAVDDANPRQHSIVRSDSYEPKPLHVDEAAEQLNKSSQEFLVFINAESDKVNVLYKLNNGDFGLIDPDV